MPCTCRVALGVLTGTVQVLLNQQLRGAAKSLIVNDFAICPDLDADAPQAAIVANLADCTRQDVLEVAAGAAVGEGLMR